MSLFRKLEKKQTSEPTGKPKKVIALEQKERKLFEQLCADKAISYSVELAPDGLYDYTYDAEREPEIREYFSTVQYSESEEQEDWEEEPPKLPSLDAQIGYADSRTTKMQEGEINRNKQQKVKSFEGISLPGQAEQNKVEKKSMGEEVLDTPTEEENDRAEKWLAEELKKLDAEAEELDSFIASALKASPNETTRRKTKKKKSKGRKNQIMTRLTDNELIKFQRRVEKAGLAQGEFIRRAVLTSKIIIEERSMVDVGVLDDLARMQAELGRQGGLLKMIIKPNLGQRELTPDEWADLMTAIRDMDGMKKRFADLEEKVKNGYRDTRDK